MFDPLPPRLLHALILSLLIHAAILAGVVSELPARLDAPAATVNVVISNDAVRATPAPAPKSSPPAAAPRSPGGASRAKVGQLLVDNSPVAAAAPPDAPSLAIEPVLASPALSSHVAESGGTPSSAPNSAPAQAREGVNANDLRQYRLALAIAARRFRHYPALARERGWEGTVELALAVSAQRSEPGVSVLRSSGHPALDRQAQEMMAQAARVTVLPESLQGRDFRVVLPVQFSLDADQ